MHLLHCCDGDELHNQLFHSFNHPYHIAIAHTVYILPLLHVLNFFLTILVIFNVWITIMYKTIQCLLV